MRILHNLVFRHYTMEKVDVGLFAFCVRRGPRGGVYGVAFMPHLPGAVPHQIPDHETLMAVAGADTALEAMAALRAGGGV